MMRKYLEVLVDDDGRFHFSTDETDSGVPKPQEFEKEFMQLTHDLTEFMWKTKDQMVSRVVRKISMAEILATAQPYEQAEAFWDNMMFHTIPRYEKYTANIKKPYGFDDKKVTRPLTVMPGTSMFPIKAPFGKGRN